MIFVAKPIASNGPVKNISKTGLYRGQASRQLVKQTQPIALPLVDKRDFVK